MSWLRLAMGVLIVGLERLRGADEDELISLAMRQDAQGKDAYQVLVERHQKWLVTFLTYMLRDQHHAEDLAQDVFVRAYFALPKFRKDASFRTWLRVIAARASFKHQRRRTEDALEPEDLERRASSSAEQDTVVDEREALSVALARVPYPYREVIVLRYVEELTIDEIAQALEIGTSAAKMRLKRGREFFKDAYTRNVEG